MPHKVDIAIPTTVFQARDWWTHLAANFAVWTRMGIELTLRTSVAATADTAANALVEEYVNSWKDYLEDPDGEMPGEPEYLEGREPGEVEVLGKQAHTGDNRDALVKDLPAEWLMFIDQDTVPPLDSLPKMLSLRKPAVAGVYFHREAPHRPVLYERRDNGRYVQLADWERGAQFEIDATGLGCSLIHREVFEGIMATHTMFVNSEGAMVTVPNDEASDERFPARFRHLPRQMYRGKDGAFYRVEQYFPVSKRELDAWGFRFFDMHNNRTEDLGFCERMDRAGYKFFVDTSIECEHLHLVPITGQMYYTLQNREKIDGGG